MSDVNDKNFNAVGFYSYGADVEVPLTLDTDWTIAAGERPSVNVATIPATQFNSIGTGWKGSVNFYFSDTPFGDDPDVTLENITIVDVQVGRVGVVKGSGSSLAQIIDYRVSFADVRHQLIPPRGGILMKGPMNQVLTQNIEAGSNSLTTNTQLIEACLDATGQSYTLGSGGFDNFPPMPNLQWFGARAPVELSKILQWIGGTLYVTSFGQIGVDLLGSGSGAPAIEPDDLIAAVQLPAIDRRGKTVVFISAPTAAQQIYTPGQDPESDENSPAWSWVARDTDGSWQELENNSLLDGLDIPTEIANGWADVDEQYRAQLAQDVYSCIQLSTDQFDPLYTSLLKQAASGKDTFLHDITVQATIARQSPIDGTWANTQNDVNVAVTHIYGNVNVIKLGERLVQVSPSPTFDPNANFQSLDLGSDVTVNFAMESAGDDGTGKGYFACGFTRGTSGYGGSPGESPIALSPEDVTSALQGGDDIVVLHSPAMVLKRVDGQKPEDAMNFNDLQGQCQALASLVLANSGTPPQLLMARGFYEAELSGVVSEIRYSQANATTSIKVNSWFAPATSFQVDPGVAAKLATARTAASGGAAGGEAFAQQDATQNDRASQGGSGADQPIHTVGAAPIPTMLRFDCACEIRSDESGTGFYDGYVADVPINPDPTQQLVIDFVSQEPSQTSQKAIIINIGEDGDGQSSGPPNLIAPGTVLLGMRGPMIGDKQIVWTYYDPTAIRSFQLIPATDSSGNKWFQGSPWGSMSNPPEPSDPSWKTLLTFQPCPTS